MSSAPHSFTRIVCFGDSITEGADIPVTHHWPKVMAEQLLALGVQVEEVYARGVGGNTAAMGMDRIDAQLAPLLPAVVLLEFGINDAYVNPWATEPRATVEQFTAHISAMIRYVRCKGGTPILLNNHPLQWNADLHSQGNGCSIVQNVLPYREAVRRLPQSENVALLNLEAALGDEFISSLHTDGIHLGLESSLLYGRAVAATLWSIPTLASEAGDNS